MAVTVVHAATSYTTAFPSTENPISEGGIWTNGGAVGVDWSNVRTTPGLAFGTQTGVDGFNDSIAVLQGTWSPDQTATGTVFSVNQQNGGVYEEVEILLRFAITPHGARGYELNFSLRNDGSQYAQIVRWNGALDDFTALDSRAIPPLQTGDRVKGTIVGNTITTFVNDVEIFHLTDSVFTDGNPGMGFYVQGTTGVNADYGFTCYSAADGGTAPPCAAPQVQGGSMTGGARVLTPSGFVTVALELQCNASDGPNTLDVTAGGNRFRLDTVTSANCTNDATIPSSGHGPAAFDTLQGKGAGKYNGAKATAEWIFTDAGEPGRNDTATIVIRNSGGVIVLTASGRLAGGNIQAHRN